MRLYLPTLKSIPIQRIDFWGRILVVVLYEYPETAARAAETERLRVGQVRDYAHQYAPSGDRLPHAGFKSGVQGVFRS